MKKQGGIVLGLGGDNSPWGGGIWYEGVMTRGYATDATDAKIFANIVAAGYGRRKKMTGRNGADPNSAAAAAAATAGSSRLGGAPRAAPFARVVSMEGDTFFDHFQFYTDADPTHGETFVYLPRFAFRTNPADNLTRSLICSTKILI